MTPASRPTDLGDLYTESGQTSQGSFSVALKPMFATKYSLERLKLSPRSTQYITALQLSRLNFLSQIRATAPPAAAQPAVRSPLRQVRRGRARFSAYESDSRETNSYHSYQRNAILERWGARLLAYGSNSLKNILINAMPFWKGETQVLCLRKQFP